MKLILAFLLSIFFSAAFAKSSPRVDADLAAFERNVTQMKLEFARVPGDAKDFHWVKAKISHMFEVDQYMRNFWKTPNIQNYSEAEKQYFAQLFIHKNNRIDQDNTRDMKVLLSRYTWFYISTFGRQIDQRAWILVQHADLEPDFQKMVLARLEEALKLKETSASNYAYLYDRVAASWNDESKRQPQRYGTQGLCTGPGQWEPIPIEDSINVDQRREAMGLSTLADYIEQVRVGCL